MSLLEQFDYLRNQNPQKRLDATLKIFSVLQIASIQQVPITSLEDLRAHYGQDAEYTFKRLIKGLASNRESARIGFSGCLAELLRSVPLIDISFVLGEIERATTPHGNVKGQEIRDNQFGRLFGIQAIVTSDLLARKQTTLEEIRELVGLLFELSMDKGWLRESCAHVLIKVLDLLAEAAIPTADHPKPSKTRRKLARQSAELVHDLLYSAKLSRTMEGLAIGLKCSELGSINSNVEAEWKGGDILRSENMQAISSIMKESETQTDKKESMDEEVGDTKLGTGAWKPKVHFAWLILIKAILSSSNEDHVSLTQFWRQLVDENLFSNTSSHERKFHGLQLLTSTLALIEPEQTPLVCSPNLMRTLVNQASKDDRYLYKAAKSTLQQVVTVGVAQPRKAYAILCELMGRNGNVMFDRITKTKTCEALMEVVPAEDDITLVQFLISLSLDVTFLPTEKEIDRQRQYIFDILVSLLRSSKKQHKPNWIIPILDFFVVNGFFEWSSKKASPGKYPFTPALSTSLRDTLKDKTKLSLGCLLSPGATSSGDGVSYAIELIKLFQLYTAKKGYTLALEPDEQILAVLSSAQTNFDELTSSYNSERSGEKQDAAFLLLYALSILQVYCGEPDGIELLSDLETTYSSLRTSDKGSTAEIQLLIDLLLAFLSKESVVTRKLVETVFVVFAPKLDRNSLSLLLNVLGASETGDGLFDTTNGDDHESDDEIDPEEIADDDDNDDDDDEDNDDDSRSEEDDDNDDENAPAEDSDDEGPELEETEADKALDAALIAALGTKRKAADVESEESEEELMDDEAMMKMDGILENIFKRRKQEHPGNKKQEQKLMTQNTVQLKSKVLDLLEIFIKTVPQSPLVVELLSPLLRLSATTKDERLTEKAQSLVRQKLTKSKILPTFDEEVNFSVANLMEILTEVHNFAASSKSPPQATTCSQSSLFITKVILHLGKEKNKGLVEAICGLYAQSQIKWMSRKKAGHGATFFTDFIGWSNQWRQK